MQVDTFLARPIFPFHESVTRAKIRRQKIRSPTDADGKCTLQKTIQHHCYHAYSNSPHHDLAGWITRWKRSKGEISRLILAVIAVVLYRSRSRPHGAFQRPFSLLSNGLGLVNSCTGLDQGQAGSFEISSHAEEKVRGQWNLRIGRCTKIHQKSPKSTRSLTEIRYRWTSKRTQMLNETA